jgi:hypothetical protein
MLGGADGRIVNLVGTRRHSRGVSPNTGWVGHVSSRSPIVPRFVPEIASRPQHHEEQTVVRSSATLIG